MLEIIERIREMERKNKQADGAKEETRVTDHLQQRKENGQSENFSKRCKLCDDTSWIEVRVDKRTCAYRCECYTKSQSNKNDGWKEAGLTLESSKLNFKNFEPWNPKILDMKDMATKYYQAFDKIKNTRQNSIILCGNSGCGKTHLCIAIANNLMKKKKKVIYMPYRDVIICIKQNMLDAEAYSITLNKYKKVEVLLIDDLFKGQITKSDVNIMFEIINYRYMNNLPMIISTELTIRKLIDIDEAVASRIYEMIKDYTVEILGMENNYRFKDI
ncbi:ATP-binding protein [Clostridium gasigenes]|nr:ATP-binding protein [Clostridium gasigenes]